MPDPTSTPDPQPMPNTAPQTHPSTALVTPHGTPVTLPGPAPAPQLSPEMASLLTAALNTLPPGAGADLLKKYYGYILVAIVPLLLTTYQNVKEIWGGPAALTAITETATKDRKVVEDLKGQLDAVQKKQAETEVKIDKVLWILSQRPGAPSSGPSF